MGKYFKESETKKIKLSEYIKYDEIEYSLCKEEQRKLRTKYIMSILGDVELDLEIYKLFLSQFQRYGGKYDVLTTKETIKGMYYLSEKYPLLSAQGLEEIWFVYIQDQFEELLLDEVLGKYIEFYGKTDKALIEYINYVNLTAKEYDERYEEEASKLEVYYEDYGYELINFLQYKIKSKHILADKIISFLPSKELIAKDKAQLQDITSKTKSYLGTCYPISYQMIVSLATDEEIDYIKEQPEYIINETKVIEATFTKQEFLESIQKRIEEAEKKLKC